MKKITAIFGIVTLLATSLSEISSCSNSTNGKGEIQLVTDGGKINDLSFVQQSWEAVKNFSIDSKKTYSNKVPSSSNSEYEFINCYKAAIKSNAKVIVTTGFLQQNALVQYASGISNDTKFIAVDFKVNGNGYKKNNIAQICYKAEQSGFWAGIASCAYLNVNVEKYMSNNKKLKIATFGGMDIEAVTSYMFGFHCASIWWNNNLNTALEISKKLKSDIDEVYPVTNIASENYSDTFSGTFKPTDGLIITEKLLDRGANIIFPVAGGQTQDVISKINSSEKGKNVKIIGVDTDQAKMYSSNKDLFLTSALKKIKKSVIDTLEKWKQNKNDPSIFTEKEIYGDYNNKLIGIVKSPNITDELIKQIETLKQPTEKVSQMWEQICQDKSSSRFWEKAMKKDIIF